MKAAVFSFTQQGSGLAQTIAPLFSQAVCYGHYRSTPLKTLVEQAFRDCEALVFVGAAGIAVRSIAPFVVSKDQDPAVLVMDEGGNFVIPILSGHMGGGNQLAQAIAGAIGAVPVITTATDVNSVFAVDTWAVGAGLHIHNIGSIKLISAALLRGEKIGFYSEYPLDGPLPDFFVRSEAPVGIAIAENPDFEPFQSTLHLTPKDYYLGVGCRRGIDEALFSETLLDLLKINGISLCKVSGLATIDIKGKERAILEFCKQNRLNLTLYSPEALAALPGEFTSSAFVQRTVGVDNVCERSAVLASAGGTLTMKKTAKNGLTLAVGKKDWRCSFVPDNDRCGS